MRTNRGRWWAVAAGVLALGLGCGGSPDEATESSSATSRWRASAIDTSRGGTTAWVRQLGGQGYERVEDLAATPDGGSVLVAHIGRTGRFGAYATSYGLVRLRPNRTVAWAREFPVAGSMASFASTAVTGLGNVFLFMNAVCDASTCPDLGGGRPSGGDISLLAKYAPDGAFVWQRVVDASPRTAVAVDANGSAAFVARREGTGAQAGVRILKFRWDGALLWDRPAPAVNGNGVAPAPSALGFDPLGNLAVGDGLAFYSLDPAGRVRWTRRLADPSVSGWTSHIGTTSLGTVVVVASPTSTGTLSWAGTTYVAAPTESGIAGFLAVAEANGAPRFGRVLASGYQVGGGAVDPAGRVAVVYQGIGGWLLEKWNLAGERLWARDFENLPGGWSSVAIDPVSHHVRCGGSFSGTVDLGTGPVTSRGESDDLVLDVWP